MKGAELLVRALEREGVGVVFGYPGGAIMPVYDALLDSKLQHVLVRHEQAAALAADGYARTTGRVGVCMSTSGPGATNLVTGIANAFMDSVPLVAITGQVPTELIGTDAFQEVDIMGITLPVVKHSFLARRTEQLPALVHEAFRVARSGRPGPVLIDLPKDVANGHADVALLGSDPPQPPRLAPQPAVERAGKLLRASRQPLAYAGGGIGIGRAVGDFRRFVETTGIPVVATLKGLGSIPTDHPLFLGMLGMHGWRAANIAVQSCDLLIAVGTRFDDRATGKLSKFAPKAEVIHIDVDPAEVGKLRRPTVGLVGELSRSLRGLSFPLQIHRWQETCVADKVRTAWNYDAPTAKVYGPRFVRELTQHARSDVVFTCDVGQHQMWMAQHGRFRRPEQLLTSGGLGTMGYGLPAAVGAQFARPEARVINLSGDGSIMMNLQELATIKRYGLPIKIVVFDNRGLGLVRQWQELFFSRRYSEVDLSDNPDFARLAEAFGIPASCVKGNDDVAEAVERLHGAEGPLLVHVLIDREANVWPLVPPNKSNSEMLEGAHK